MLEAYAVLTRLPGGLAVPANVASEVLSERFPKRPFTVPAAERGTLTTTLARAGVIGGSSYDGLVALEAAAHAQPLLTLDRRAQDVYRRLGAAFEVIGG
jgi:hypothetical protein